MAIEVAVHCPSLLNWFNVCYGSRSFLWCGTKPLVSSCGVQQGDPLGPLLFGLGIAPLAQELRQRVDALDFQAWYLDDGTLGGTAQSVERAVNFVREWDAHMGLQLNVSKSEVVYSPEFAAPGNCATLASFARCSSEAFGLLSAPCGSAAHIEVAGSRALKKAADVAGRIGRLTRSTRGLLFASIRLWGI